MKQILHLISSPRGDDSFSIKLANAIIEKLRGQYPEIIVDEVNLAASRIPHLDTGHLQSFFTLEFRLHSRPGSTISQELAKHFVMMRKERKG